MTKRFAQLHDFFTGFRSWKNVIYVRDNRSNFIVQFLHDFIHEGKRAFKTSSAPHGSINCNHKTANRPQTITLPPSCLTKGMFFSWNAVLVLGHVLKNVCRIFPKSLENHQDVFGKSETSLFCFWSDVVFALDHFLSFVLYCEVLNFGFEVWVSLGPPGWVDGLILFSSEDIGSILGYFLIPQIWRWNSAFQKKLLIQDLTKGWKFFSSKIQN